MYQSKNDVTSRSNVIGCKHARRVSRVYVADYQGYRIIDDNTRMLYVYLVSNVKATEYTCIMCIST